MIKLRCLFIIALYLVSSQTLASEITSAYTKLDLEKDCTFISEYENGASATCKGYEDIEVHFSEGDLRQQVRYGVINDEDTNWESFSEFNHINDTIEWRIKNAKPFATILRWFISNTDPDEGQPTQKTRGNILVVSKIGTEEKPQSCIIGYVDARANKDANVIARQVADGYLVDGFKCGLDKPRFHGSRGKWSGNPTAYAE